MIALTVDTAKNIAILVLAAVLVAGVLAVKITKTVTQKAVAVVIVLCIGLGVWTQRTNVTDCAEQVRSGQESSTTCTFFGQEVTVR